MGTPDFSVPVLEALIASRHLLRCDGNGQKDRDIQEHHMDIPFGDE